MAETTAETTEPTEAAAEPTEATAETTPDAALPETESGDYSTESTETPAVTAPREIVAAPGAATGRRKQAIARVRLTPGTGQWTVNNLKLEQYFPNKVHQQLVNDPFVTLEIDKRFDVVARIHGGGVSGQAGALRLAIARALNLIDEDGNRPALKRAGFLTRDPRAKERKKYGLKKARKAPQYSKR